MLFLFEEVYMQFSCRFQLKSSLPIEIMLFDLSKDYLFKNCTNVEINLMLKTKKCKFNGIRLMYPWSWVFFKCIQIQVWILLNLMKMYPHTDLESVWI